MTTAAHVPSATEEIHQPDAATSLRALCAQIHARIEAFLQEDVETEKLRRVQAQTRISLGVISEALQRYR